MLLTVDISDYSLHVYTHTLHAPLTLHKSPLVFISGVKDGVSCTHDRDEEHTLHHMGRQNHAKVKTQCQSRENACDNTKTTNIVHVY